MSSGGGKALVNFNDKDTVSVPCWYEKLRTLSSLEGPGSREGNWGLFALQ